MGRWSQFIDRAGGRRAIVAIGGFYVAIAAVQAFLLITENSPYESVLIITLLISVSGLTLVYGGYLLPRTDIRSEFYTDITVRCLGGFGMMFGILLFYSIQPGVSFTESFHSVIILTALSTTAGFGLGIYDAKAKTQRREVEETMEQLKTSNKRLEQFAYAASHDLQEPLRMVSSYLQLIERRSDDELTEETREFLDFAVDGANRMRAMIEGLLAYSRVETQGAPFETVGLTDVVADARKDLEMQISESDATIEVAKLPRVEGDESQLRQVFQNLLSNAITYAGDEPPCIQVSAERNGTHWTISVRDEGIGIDPEEQEHIFEVFARLQTKGDRNGSGIGLALCERIIERHKGDIWVDSEPGKGSTFSFSVPADGY